MKRSSTVASAAILAALSLSTAAPAGAAVLGGPGTHGHHGHHATTVKVHAQKSHVNKNAVAQVLRDVAHLDKRLVVVSKDSRLAALSADDKAAVLANVAADRADLTAFAAEVRTANTVTDLKQVRHDLRNIRPTNYVLVVNDLRAAARLAAEIATQSAQAAPDSPEAQTLADASAQVTAAVDKARTITAESTKVDLNEVKTALHNAQVSVDNATA